MKKTSKKKAAPTVGSQEPKETGRPTDYGPDIIAKAIEYRDNLPKDEVMHSVEGLAIYIGIARSTVYEWVKDDAKKEFSDIFEDVLSRQGRTLINNGVSGKFNSTITKVMLTKHGYREGIEQSGEGGGPVKHLVDITDQLNKTYGDDSASEVSGDGA